MYLKQLLEENEGITMNPIEANLERKKKVLVEAFMLNKNLSKMAYLQDFFHFDILDLILNSEANS